MAVPNKGNGNECERTGLGRKLAYWRASRKKYSSRQLSRRWSLFYQRKFILFHMNGVNPDSIGRRMSIARLVGLPVKFDISALKFASAYFQSGRAKEFNRFVVHSVTLTILVSITFFGFWLVAPQIGLGRLVEFSPSIAIAILFWTITRLLVSLIRATGHQVWSLICDRIIRDGILVVATV